MTDQAHVPTHWALIIGINHYPRSRCLRGSVRDAHAVQDYLEAGTQPIDIAMLTATAPLDANSDRPVEEPHAWPTFPNVRRHLKRIIDSAKSGDRVYVHYSGHGVVTPSESALTSGELALVLLDDNYGQRYLQGRDLARYLHVMVEKKLFVTLVLDCCFSGAVVRNDWYGIDVRSIDYDPRITAISQSEHDMIFDRSRGLRDAQMERDWLLNPDGYTILTACGPQEKAWELESEGERRGALSFFLLRALSTLRHAGVELTYQSVHAHLAVIFHAKWPRQTPMRYGQVDFSFFGDLITPPNAAFIPLYKTEKNKLRLRAGQAHGVEDGDDYAAYPFDASEHTDHEYKHFIALKVKNVYSLEAELTAIDQEFDTSKITTGWKAKLITSLSKWKVGIHVTARVKSLCQATADIQFAHLLVDKDDSCIFTVIASKGGEYEVVNVLGDKIGGLPTLHSDGTALRETLQHLATYKFFEAIENRLSNPAFERSLSLKPNSNPTASGTFDVKDGSVWGFTIENIGQPLYIAIFNFKASWEVVNLTSASGKGDYLLLSPRDERFDGKMEILLKMDIPGFLRGSKKASCEDIIKVFITSRPTAFPSMVLPKMSLDGNKPRGLFHNHDTLSKFLAELATGFRDQEGPHGDWTTRNFIIRTVV